MTSAYDQNDLYSDSLTTLAIFDESNDVVW